MRIKEQGLVHAETAPDLVDLEVESHDPHGMLHVSRDVLKTPADAIDELVHRSELEDLPSDQIAILREAVDMGRRLWSATIREHPQRFTWNHVECRSYLRALKRLVEVLEEIGDIEDATRTSDYILRINPADDTNVRWHALVGHIELGNWTKASAILRAHRDEESIWMGYSRVLVCLHNKGNAEPLFAKAMRINPHVPGLIGRRFEKPHHADPKPGSRAEAETYAFASYNGWRNAPDAVEWVRQTAHLS